MDEVESSNFQLFRECLSTPLIEKSRTTPTKIKRKVKAGRKTAIKPVAKEPGDVTEQNDAEELGEFIAVSVYHLLVDLSTG